jgi:hypothetical protein
MEDRRKVMSESSCCPSAEGATATRAGLEQPADVCPSCGHQGKPVDGQTVKALLAVSLLQVTHQPYRFCPTPGCLVVYYSADGAQIFTIDQLRERVYHKESQTEEVLVCYCFRHTVASIREEIERTGHSTVVDEITQGTRRGYCACDIRNPQGSCCLGDVRALVKRLSHAAVSPE